MSKLWIDELVSSKARAHIAFAGELEFLGAAEDDRTGRTVQFRIVRRPDELMSAHPFATFTRRRRGHAGTRFESVFTAVANPAATTKAEIMLLNWSDGPGGSTVKFLLDFSAEKHPFLGCTRRTKDAAGTSFMAVLMEIDDDDAIVNQEKRARVERAHQKLSNVAAMFVKNARFHEWLREVAALPEGADADAWLKSTLGIKSKAELDKDNRAAAAFLKLKAAFVEWQTANGYDIEE